MVKYGQSLLDVALGEYGDASAIVQLAQDNNLSITSDLEVGQVLLVDESKIIKQNIVSFFSKNGINLATDIPRPNKLQTIIFPSIPQLQINDVFYLSATASSGLFVRYVSSNPSVISVENNQITVLAPGEATITAYQDGNSIYFSAVPVSISLEISKLSQTITLPNIPDALVGDTLLFVPATTSSGLPVSYVISDENIIYFSGANLYFQNAGTVTITANQAGNATYLPASVSQEIVVSKRAQSITFNLIDNAELSLGTIIMGATASSGLPVSYSSSNPAIASISENLLTLLQVGTVVITASQAGNFQYNAATSVNESLVITASVVNILFDFDFSQSGKFTLDGSNNVLSYTDRGITLSPFHTGASTIQMTVDGVRVGSGTFGDSGSTLAASIAGGGLSNVKEIFLVVAQGRNGAAAGNYSRSVFATRRDTGNVGVQVQLDTTSMRTTNQISGTNTSHTTRRVSSALTESSQTNTTPTLTIGAVNTFKVIRITLNSHSGDVISLGKLFSGINVTANGTGGAHPVFKRVILADCTATQGATIYSNLRTQYGI